MITEDEVREMGNELDSLRVENDRLKKDIENLQSENDAMRNHLDTIHYESGQGLKGK